MPNQQLRIITGQWRGRKLSFPAIEGLRPTPDRVRETLFNWLMSAIENATCLDLFAGSGALGFEALSRGAKQVTFVDRSIKVTQQLQKNAETLSCEAQVSIHRGNGLSFLKNNEDEFDIIFIDPPFQQGLAPKAIDLLKEAKAKYIYVEQEQQAQLPTLPEHWEIFRENKMGNTRVYLIKVEQCKGARV